MIKRNFKLDTTSLIISIVFIVLLFMVLSFIVGSIFTILKWVSPVLIILALVFDYQTVLNYGKWLVDLTRRNPLHGIGAILLSVFFYPVVFAYLLTRAFFKKKYKGMMQEFENQKQSEFIDYEEVEDKPLSLDKPPRRAKPIEKKNQQSEYDDLFE